MSGAYRTADATIPAHSAFAVTPSDATVFPTTRGLYVGVAGNINVRMAEDDAVVLFIAVPVGTILPVQATQVLATSTTATNLVALN